MKLQEILDDLPVIDVTDSEKHYAVAFAEVKQDLLYPGDTQSGYLFGKDKDNTTLYLSRFGITDENGTRMANPNDIFISLDRVGSIEIHKEL